MRSTDLHDRADDDRCPIITLAAIHPGVRRLRTLLTTMHVEHTQQSTHCKNLRPKNLSTRARQTTRRNFSQRKWPTTNTANQLNFEASILGLSDPAFPTAGKKVDPLHLRPCVRGAHQKRSCYSRRSPKSRARLLRPCSLNLSFFTVESAVIRMLPFNRQWQRQTRHAAATKPGVPI